MTRTPDQYRRFGRICEWARRRYTKAGRLTLSAGVSIAGRPFIPGTYQPPVPSRYSLIEDMAGARYLGLSRHWPGETLATAYHPTT